MRLQTRAHRGEPRRQSRSRARAWGAAILAVTPGLVTPQAWGVVRTWVVTSGNWSTPSNWSGGVVPTSSDDAGILGAVGLNARSAIYDYTGPPVTLLFFRLDGSIAGNGPNTLTQGANTLRTATEQIGISDRGLYNLSGGTNTVDGLLTLGMNTGTFLGRGTISISGTGVLSAGSIIVGDAGTGNIILNGGTVSSGNVIVANTGLGQVEHSSGSFLMSQFSVLRIAAGSLSSGAYNLSGSGFSSVLSAGSIIVGDLGSATFTQTGGVGTSTASGIRIGNGAGGRGVWSLSGGSVVSPQFIVGNNGSGTVNHSAGFNNATTSFVVGSGTTSIGVYNLSGTGQLTTFQSPTVSIGSSGVASFNHSGGTFNCDASTLVLGVQSSGSGVYTLNGAGASLRSGGVTIGQNGTGIFNQSDGDHRISGSTNELRLGSGANSTGVYTLSGGNLSVSGDEFIGVSGAGTFIQSGGSHGVGGDQDIGPSFGSGTGTYLLSGGSLSVFGRQTVNTNGQFIQTGGTNQVSSNALNVEGSYALSNGTLIAQNLNVSGSFVQTSGTTNVGLEAILPGFPTTNGALGIGGGRYQLAGGTLNAFGASGAVFSGSFEHTAGVNNFNGLLLIGFPGAAGAAGTYLFNGGSLSVNPATIVLSNGNELLLDGLLLSEGGTFASNAPGGIFHGKFTQGGGTVTGTLRNAGTFVFNSGTFDGQLINLGTAIVNGGSFAPAMGLINEDDASLEGFGTIAAALTNRGSVTVRGSLAVASISNTGSITVPATSSLVPGVVDNLGQIHLTGGRLLGSGSISNNAGVAGGGGMIAGGGTISLNLVQNGGIIRADDPSRPLVITSPISITNPSSQMIVASNSMLSLQQPLSNSGIISLQSPGSRLIGGAITNTGTIKGSGEIANQLINSGILRAEGGELIISGPNASNLAAGQIQTGSNAIRFTQGLGVNLGRISMLGGEVDFGSGSMTNNGTLTGRGAILAGNLINAGTFILSGATTDIFPPITNQGRITVVGNGAATFYGPVNNSAGTINIALGSMAAFLAPVTGLGSITGPGSRHFESTASSGAINANGTTVVGPEGNLTTSVLRDQTLWIFGRAQQVPDGTPAGVCRVNTLLIDGTAENWTGRWDLADNDLIIDAASLATTSSQIKSGLENGGAFDWLGPGIGSTQANVQNTTAGSFLYGLGVVLNDLAQVGGSGPIYTSFAGQSLTGNEILVKFTYFGDADLSGSIDATDYSLIDNGYVNSLSGWINGDFDYSGSIDATDYALIDNAYVNQAGPLAEALIAEHVRMFGGEYLAALRAVQSGVIPEPASVMMFMLGAWSLKRSGRQER
ncbi:beta strand repeat-containing protein [Fontivita pretiosa]|uniref:beta strand repeat-containing protein n=1 Tax=Fontivita pretiosa TaxID=2989684 RepID=UPI003D17F8ED